MVIVMELWEGTLILLQIAITHSFLVVFVIALVVVRLIQTQEV